MQNNRLIIAVIAALVIGGGAGFFSGVKYQQSKAQNLRGSFNQRFSGGQAGGVLGASGGQGRVRVPNGSGFSGGEIINKDDKSITVKLLDGGSKIVYFSQSTQISKPQPAQAADLNIGDTIVVMGTAGTDGSVTAQSIQVRPAMSAPNP